MSILTRKIVEEKVMTFNSVQALKDLLEEARYKIDQGQYDIQGESQVADLVEAIVNEVHEDKGEHAADFIENFLYEEVQMLVDDVTVDQETSKLSDAIEALEKATKIETIHELTNLT